MKKRSVRRANYPKTDALILRPKASVSAAVCFALYGLPHSTWAQTASDQQQTQPSTGALQEVVVTAERRAQSLESVPYSLSVVSGDDLKRAEVTDITSLASQVPGLSIYNIGARASWTTFPIIRGLNASAAESPSGGNLRTFEQSPVGTYIGNSPIDGYFWLDDVQHVEVLRGPQGTLYGAGALGGALRIIPNAPELQKFAGNIELGGGRIAHSSGTGYTASGMLNIPLGDTLAVRVSGKYGYQPGYIDVYGILERTGSLTSGLPVLANPADPATSSGIFTGKSDWNYQRTFTGRGSLLWQPVDKFSAQLAFTYGWVKGDAGPDTNPDFRGGAYPIDPRITFPKGGDYQFFTAADQPWNRTTELSSLDLSYDAGFATVSATTSYYTTDGQSWGDGTYSLVGFPTFVGYYAGNPVNPRYVNPYQFGEDSHTITQEVRLVSTTAPDKRFDYVVGFFYEHQERNALWYVSNPGTAAYSRAIGCTAPYFYGGSFPDCLVTSGPNDIYFTQIDMQKFQDVSEFGELTWHFAPHGQLTVGLRHFEQQFTDTQYYADYPFNTYIPAPGEAPTPRSSPASKNTWKINPSYEYAPNQLVYALWSQGFRRGGANAVPQNPPSPIGEKSLSLLTYAPDSTDNYEIGVKGRLTNGMSYTFAVFDILWHNPQVAGRTPVGNFAVWNANQAKSTGAELDLIAPLFLQGLSIKLSGAYVNARFTEDYFIEADAFGNIMGTAGQQLPGSPKTSVAGTLIYERSLAGGYDFTTSLNDTYRSAMYLSTFPIIGQTAAPQISGENIINLSGTLSHQPWRLGLYVTNLADKRVITAPTSQYGEVGYLTSDVIINQPREIDLRVGYSF